MGKTYKELQGHDCDTALSNFVRESFDADKRRKLHEDNPLEYPFCHFDRDYWDAELCFQKQFALPGLSNYDYEK